MATHTLFYSNHCKLTWNLEEVVASSYQDIDMAYAKQNKIGSKKMDYWNMHTFSNVVISPDKI